MQELYNSYDDKKTETNSEKTKAEALDKIGMYVAAGMEVPKVLQKQAGLSDDDLKAYIGSSTSASSSSGTSNKLTASDAKGISSQVADLAGKDDLEGADAYLSYLVSQGYLTEQEAMSFLAPYVNVEEDEVVDTTVDIPTTGFNTLPFSTSGNNNTIVPSPAELLDMWTKKGKFTGLSFEEWSKSVLGTK